MFLDLVVDRVQVCGADAELGSLVGFPHAVGKRGLVAGVIDSLAVVERLEEQAEGRRQAQGEQWPEFHEGVLAFAGLEVGDVGGAVVFALPVFEQLQV